MGDIVVLRFASNHTRNATFCLSTFGSANSHSQHVSDDVARCMGVVLAETHPLLAIRILCLTSDFFLFIAAALCVCLIRNVCLRFWGW